MSIDTTFEELYAQHLRPVYERLHDLRTSVVEDCPAHDHVLVDLLADRLDDGIGWLVEAEDASLEGQQALQAPVDFNRARQALQVCQTKFHRTFEGFFVGLLQFDTSAALIRVGQERGPAWRAWANSVRGALEECRAPMFEVDQALFQCCFELASSAAVATAAYPPNEHHGK
jgi:hypothetical protein